MAFNDIEMARCKREIADYIESKRPPTPIRNKLDFGFRIEGQSIEIFEIRPRWDDPQETIETPVAKVTYVKKNRVWKLYWQRADLKWHSYQPNPTVPSLKAFLAVIDEDQYGCFWG